MSPVPIDDGGLARAIAQTASRPGPIRTIEATATGLGQAVAGIQTLNIAIPGGSNLQNIPQVGPVPATFPARGLLQSYEGGSVFFMPFTRTGPLPVAHGGTGATNASAAQTNLGIQCGTTIGPANQGIRVNFP
jgi:hypothetical protein